MITGTIKSQIDQIRNAFWSGGISNPLVVIEQITYLLLLRRLDDLHTLEENKSARFRRPMERRVFPEGEDPKGRPYDDLRWSRFKHFAPADMYAVIGEHAFPFLRTFGGDDSTYAHHMKDARFTIPSPALLAKVVDLLDATLREHFHHRMFHGFDFDNTMLRIGSINMLLHGVENPDIRYRDSLGADHAAEEAKYTLVLANPPFAGSLDYENTAKDLLHQASSLHKREVCGGNFHGRLDERVEARRACIRTIRVLLTALPQRTALGATDARCSQGLVEYGPPEGVARSASQFIGSADASCKAVGGEEQGVWAAVFEAASKAATTAC